MMNFPLSLSPSLSFSLFLSLSPPLSLFLSPITFSLSLSLSLSLSHFSLLSFFLSFYFPFTLFFYPSFSLPFSPFVFEDHGQMVKPSDLTISIDLKLQTWTMQISSCGVLTNVMDCNIVVSEFELQLRYNVQFWTYTLNKSMKLPPANASYGLTSTTSVFLQGWHRH